MEGGCLALRDFLHEAVELAGRGLIETGFFLQPQKADCLEQAQRTDGINIGGIFRRLKADRNMALRAQIIDFVRLYLVHDPRQVRGIGQVSIMEFEAGCGRVGILVYMIDPLRVERGGAPLDTVNLITFGEQKLR